MKLVPKYCKFLRGLCLLLFMATKSPQYDSFFSNFRFFLMEKTNERNVHGPKGMVILHNFMCSLLPCLFVFQNVCLFRSVLLMIFAAIFRQCRKFNIHALNSIQTNSIYKVLCKRLAVKILLPKTIMENILSSADVRFSLRY